MLGNWLRAVHLRLGLRCELAKGHTTQAKTTVRYSWGVIASELYVKFFRGLELVCLLRRKVQAGASHGPNPSRLSSFLAPAFQSVKWDINTSALERRTQLAALKNTKQAWGRSDQRN